MENENKKSESALREERVLEFWRANKIFSKTLSETKGRKEFVFYEGPPTANAKPALHHLEARAFKDAIPRYKTMQGFHVRRKAGWDTHGLPVELQVEKKLGLNSKKAIEEYGIAKFNRECRESVWQYVGEWEKFTERVGYWVDKDNPYITYDNSYIESVWNIIKTVDDQKLLYKDYKVVPWCPRCATALSSHELAQGYEDVKDLSIYAKFRIRSSAGSKFPQDLLLRNVDHSEISSGSATPATYFLAWTTTPWTLPGNIALAVGKDIDYAQIKVGSEVLVLAKDRLSVITEPYEIVAEYKGKDLIGLEYEPLFPYLKEQLEQKGESTEKAFRVYEADFVNTTDGTGIVHTAVMYGQDDFDLGTKVGLPKYHLVNAEGRFVAGTDFLEGRFVKEKSEDGKPTFDVDIIKYLQDKNLFFKKELYEHSYPHCWRCKTALIYYARDSWYIRMSDKKIKDKLISENKTINWEPEYTREGRFGEWLREIKDWAISRERYWGTPLPVWLSGDGEKIVVDSCETLRKYVKKSGNKYFVMRHGGTDGNKKGIVSYKNQANDHLTEEGKKQVIKSAGKLKKEKIDLIVTSNFVRTKQTAEVMRSELGLGQDQVVEDPRIRELNPGEYDGRSWAEYHAHMVKIGNEWFHKNIAGGESLAEMRTRTAQTLYELEEKYKNKNILLVTHGGPAWVLFVNAGMFGPDNKKYHPENESVFIEGFKNFENAEFRPLPFVPMPHDANFAIDLHRPFIDEVVLEKDGKEFHRTREVMDVWLDSGAMPFAQDHYPFDPEPKRAWYGAGKQKILYPADYISEAIDQTRGWFYTLHAVGVLMGRGRAYKNVICLGHLLDAKGKKMSKSIGNIVEPFEAIDKHGVDTLRLWMYSVNQPGESKNFDEKTVALLSQQVFGLLYNVLAFYELYRDTSLESKAENIKPKNILDQWILVKLNELVQSATENMENYKLLEPNRAIKEFIGDLSTWYLRRSRERIKEGTTEDSREAKQTLYFVLKTLAKLLAPFAPFSAEDIWLKLKHEGDKESVHLANWPKAGKIHSGILENMRIVREVVSQGLEARQRAKIQVRQPLQKLEVKNFNLKAEYVELIKDELNVKEVVENKKLETEVLLDVSITGELKAEGNYRELVRAIQDLRKKMGLTPSDVVALSFETSGEGEELVRKFEADMKKVILASKIEFNKNDGEEVKVGELIFKVKIEK